MALSLSIAKLAPRRPISAQDCWCLHLRLALGATMLILAARAPGATLAVGVTATSEGAPLEYHRVALTNAAGEGISISRLDCLLTGLALRRTDGQWHESMDWSAFLSLAEGRTRFHADGIPVGRYDQLRFRVGVPGALNHSDPAKYPADHSLNPNLNGLHWSWQGGYIFLALEGRWSRAPVSKPAGAATNEFRASAENGPPSTGGYSLHFANDWNLTTVTVPVALDLTGNGQLALELDIARLLRDFCFARDGTSTHARKGDPIAVQLAAALPHAFRSGTGVPPVRMDSHKRDARATADLPALFTPYRFEMSAVFPVPDLPADNPLIEGRVALGRALFHEPLLSRDNSISCASCHVAADGFSDARRYSVGVSGRNGTRQAMPLFNLAWKNTFFWDGRAPSLRAQALMPIEDHAEMDETLERVVSKLGSNRRKEAPSDKSEIEVSLLTLAATAGKNYPELFTAAFGSPDITPEKIGLALENFLLTLTSHESKFDRAHGGEPGVTLSEQERRGFELFFTEYDPRRGQFGADCFHCHGGANFSNHGFANNGLDATFTDIGRFAVTGREADRGRFAVPSLRNIALTAPYMHDGRFATLEEVVAHYTSGVKASATLDPNLAKHPTGGVPLSAADRAALVAFLQTLTDERFANPTGTGDAEPQRAP